MRSSNSRTPRRSGSSAREDQNRCFVFSLVCPYLMARDIFALSLTNSAIKLRLRSGAARTLRVNLSRKADTDCQRFHAMLAKSFPHAKELILSSASREQAFAALKGAAHLQLTRLSISLTDQEGESLEATVDGRALACGIAGFPLLERLELRSVGPLAPWSFLKACSGESLQMVRLTRCPTLMDSCLNALIAQALHLRELSVEDCASLVSPTVSSDSLVRLRLSRCFSLRRVNIAKAESLMILDIPWTVWWVEPPLLLKMPSIRYLSLAGATELRSFEVDRLPSTLSSLDLGCCTKLKSVSLGHCVGLVYLNVTFCVELETINLRQARVIEELELTLLTSLQSVTITEDYCLKRLILFGCDKLPHEAVHVSPSCKKYF